MLPSTDDIPENIKQSTNRFLNKAFRLIAISVLLSTIIGYLLIFHFPETNREMRKHSSIHRSLRIDKIRKYGMDTRLNSLTTFSWTRVCILNNRQEYNLEKQTNIAIPSNYEVIGSTPSSLRSKWALLFLADHDKVARWLAPCKGLKCLKISTLQTTGCLSIKASLRHVYVLNEDDEIESSSLLLTEPNQNLPKNKSSKLGATQNYLRIYKHD